MSSARIIRYLIGVVISAILLAIILPFVGVPSSQFLPPAHVWSQAQGYARGTVVDKYYDVTNDPFNVGGRLYFVDYQFKANTPVPTAQAEVGKPMAYTGTCLVDSPSFDLILKPKTDNGTYKATDKQPVMPGQFVRVRYETTYPYINGVTALYQNGNWLPMGGRNIGAGSNNLSGWIIWILVALALGYVFMMLLEKFAARENI